MQEVAKNTEKPVISEKHEDAAAKLSESVWHEMQHGNLPSNKAEKPAAKDGSLEMTDPFKSKCGPMNFNPSAIEQGKPEAKNPAESSHESKPRASEEGVSKKPAPLVGTDSLSGSGEHKESKGKEGITKEELKDLFKNWKVPGEAMKIGS